MKKKKEIMDEDPLKALTPKERKQFKEWEQKYGYPQPMQIGKAIDTLIDAGIDFELTLSQKNKTRGLVGFKPN